MRSAGLLVIWMLLPLAPALAQPTEEGFVPIFDGKSLEGWDGDPRFWSVQDGAITGLTTAQDPTKGNTFLIWKDGELDDFELRARFRIENHNSGIQFRSEHLGNYVVKGYQADIDATGNFLGACYSERTGRGLLAVRGKKVRYAADGTKSEEALPAVGSKLDPTQWSEYVMVARGSHIVQKIDGQVMCEVLDALPGARRSGILALQLHAGPPMKVQFKDIRLKRLALADQKKLVLVAGRPSHGFGAHEFNAGAILLKARLDENVPQLLTALYRSGWPKDPTAFDNADAICLYMDGGGSHPVIGHLEEIDRLMKKGVGLACVHYAVEVPKGPPGERFLEWIGGYFETFWSVNPHWRLAQTALADHPIARGVRPFEIDDEWYYHMRFRSSQEGVTSILSAVPPESTRTRGTGTARGGNEAVLARKGMSEVLAWACERPDGGRGFGFTGGHVHWNWVQDDFRKLVLNALTWVSKVDVPAAGVPSKTPTPEEMLANQDEPPPKGFDRVQLQAILDRVRGHNETPSRATP